MTEVVGTSGAGRDMRPAKAPERVRVWDPLVRIFHWSLVATVSVSWVTGGEIKQVHIASGYVVLGLVATRIVWGLIGTRHARFRDFIYGPRAILGFLRDTLRFRAQRYHGHNPAGGAMVLALLLVLSATCATGYMMTTDTFWGVEWVEKVHHFAASFLLVLIGFHIAGVAIASIEHRENLVKAMFTGWKRR
jgi:cytochrome b